MSMADPMSAEKLQFLSYQLEDFQTWIPGSPERFSDAKFHQTLTDILNKEFFSPSQQKTKNIREPLTSIKQFKSLAYSMKNGGRHVLFTFDELAVISQYAKLLEFMAELKSYFDDRILEVILNLSSWWKDIKMADSDRKFFDDVRKLNGCSLSENEIKMSTDSLNQVKAIELRWTKMMECEELCAEFFEDETVAEMSSKNKMASSRPICYVLSDLIRKLKKCVELSTQWLQAVSSSVKRDACMRSPPIDNRRRIIETWIRILEVDESIFAEERNVDRLKTELKRLADKEMRYAMLENDHEATAGKLEEVCSDYRNALLERHSLNRKIQEESMVSEEGVALARLHEVGERIKTAHKDMKMIKYSLALLQEDMALEASMRSSYIRFEESVKEMLLEAETQIEVKKRKKRELDKELILLKANSKWFELKHGMGENDEVFDDENIIERARIQKGEIQSSEQMDSKCADSNHELEWKYENQKHAENDRFSQNSPPSNTSGSPKPYQSTHARLILQLPVTQNSNDKREWKYNKHKTRIPKLIVQ